MRRLPSVTAILIFVCLATGWGCASRAVQAPPPQSDIQPAPVPIPLQPEPAPAPPTPGNASEASPAAGPLPQQEAAAEEVQETPQTPAPGPSPQEVPSSNEPEKKSDQEILDSALEFLQASYEFWEKSEFENAISALDEAYALILTIEGTQNAGIQQQKEDLRITISRRIVEYYSSRFTMANGRYDAIPLTKNSYVEKALALFTQRDKSSFIEAYRRSGRYRPAIVEALAEAGLPKELSWLPLIESGFKVRALSRARALGLWQFIASTGYKFGLKRDPWIDERMDPDKSTKAAIAYLKELHQIFGDWTTVLAAYNCGEWTVLKAIRSQRINYLDNFWDLYERLPAETAFYVPKFLAVLHILNDPEGYGMRLPEPDPVTLTEGVALNKQVHLREVAKRIDVPYEDLLDLNPELRLDATPPTLYSLKVPQGKVHILTAQIDALPLYRPPSPAFVLHRVVPGDSLSSIAQKYRTSVRTILAANGLSSSHFLKVGWKLKIPTGRHGVPSADHKAQGPETEKERGLSKYTVQKGDSLWEIANRHGTSVKAIQAMNSLEHSRLRVGQVLLLPSGSLTPPPGVKTRLYKVTDGDTPYMIAQKHNMTLSEFLKLNDLTPRSRIQKGQTVFVKAE